MSLNRRHAVAILGGTCLSSLLPAVSAQEPTGEQEELFTSAEGVVFRRLDVEVSSRNYAWERTEQHALLDWYGVVYPDEVTAEAIFEAWDEKIGGFGDPPATWLFPTIEDYNHPSQTFFATTRGRSTEDSLATGENYLYSEWDPQDMEKPKTVGHIFMALRGRVLVAGLVTNAEGYEDVHLAMMTNFLSRTYCQHILLDTPLPAPGEVVDEARLLSLAPNPELITDAEDIDGCTEIETWTLVK